MRLDLASWLKTIASASLILASLAGCSILPSQTPADNIYLLEASAVPVPPLEAVEHDIVLAVSMPRARAGFTGTEMIWLHQAHELDAYSRNRWADTPARMLAPLFVQTLKNSGAFHAVVPYPSSTPAMWRLDTELIRLQQDFTVKPSEVRFTLGAQLIDIATQRVIATAEFDEVEKCDSEDAYGGVLAANRALERMLIKLTAFSAAHVR